MAGGKYAGEQSNIGWKKQQQAKSVFITPSLCDNLAILIYGVPLFSSFSGYGVG